MRSFACILGTACIVLAFLMAVSSAVFANPNQPPPFTWARDNVKVVFTGDGNPIAKTVDGKQCIETANTNRNRFLYFDIDNDYVFDSDVEAQIEIVYDSTVSGPILFEYDSNYLKEKHEGTFHQYHQIAQPDKSTRWARHLFKLTRARFADRQHRSADFRISSPKGMLRISDLKVSLDKSFAAPEQNGKLKLRVVDETTGKITPARIGIYDTKQRFKPPAEDSNAVPINVFYRTLKMFNCRQDTTWPIANTYAFWTYGEYECELPAGKYQIIVRKGIEYYLVEEWITIEAGKTLEHTVKLKQWVNMAEKGWYSGDCHVHIGRTPEQNSAVMAQCRGEDLNVSNLAQMGNIETYYFRQYAFGEAGKYRLGKYVLIPSQEEPRTPHRGHSLLLNMKSMVRDDETYYLYHKAYQRTREQGGLVGYAHMGLGFFAERGMALDMPFGLIDFVEMLQVNNIEDRVFYEFLNLGYKLVPTAGSDYPYIDPPGSVRNYVYLDGPYSDQGWFDALAEGRTFVTTGPILTFTVNGANMGEELGIEQGAPLNIEATAVINPTMDKLKQIQLIIHGDTVTTVDLPEGEQSLKLSYQMAAEQSVWMAVKVTCEGKLLAHTAPIYVTVDGRRFWKKQAVRKIVATQRQRLRDLIEKPVKPIFETWINDTLQTEWNKQKSFLEQRVEQANAKYEELLKLLRSEE
ncbi:MAG: CehA/McbA family metallohydrolase [Planctomycetota bacterium]|nr:MAG: CehA/McbA family metallohydrolase [Planctomycetota bacterium]